MPDIKSIAAEYCSWDTNDETRATIQELLDAGDTEALERALQSGAPVNAGFESDASGTTALMWAISQNATM